MSRSSLTRFELFANLGEVGRRGMEEGTDAPGRPSILEDVCAGSRDTDGTAVSWCIGGEGGSADAKTYRPERVLVRRRCF